MAFSRIRLRSTMASFALAAFALSAPPGGAEPFRGSAEPIDPQLRQRMTGVSWHPGCPVGFGRLRLLRVTHWGFDGEVHRGRLVVHRDSAGAMLRTLRQLYHLRFPIRRMRLVDAYGGDDHRSMAADNTSAFNCRTVAGTSRWSEHAFGHAIDVNPVENPYVTADGYVSPPAGAPYKDRSQRAKGLIHRRGPSSAPSRRTAGGGSAALGRRTTSTSR